MGTEDKSKCSGRVVSTLSLWAISSAWGAIKFEQGKKKWVNATENHGCNINIEKFKSVVVIMWKT